MTTQRVSSKGTNDGNVSNRVSETRRSNQTETTQNEENELLLVGSFGQAVAITEELPGNAPEFPEINHSGLLRWDEDMSRSLAIYAVHGGPGATYGKPIVKMVVRSGTSSSFIVWLLVIMIGVRETQLRERLFNLYIG